MASLQENCVAIGECGLDKLRGVSLHQQMDWLHEILSLPIDKPIILHCVRAHEELLSIIKQYPHQYIIHGFRKGTSLAQKYLALGYSLSLGIEGLDLLNTIGKEASFFLETDTAPWHISEVYLKACSLLNLDIDTLATLIETRFRITFATWPRIGKNAQD
jgi:TatD DNase family protein